MFIFEIASKQVYLSEIINRIGEKNYQRLIKVLDPEKKGDALFDILKIINNRKQDKNWDVTLSNAIIENMGYIENPKNNFTLLAKVLKDYIFGNFTPLKNIRKDMVKSTEYRIEKSAIASEIANEIYIAFENKKYASNDAFMKKGKTKRA